MRVCLYEDAKFGQLEPLNLTRPVFDLICGRTSLARKQRDYFNTSDMGALVRHYLADLVAEQNPAWHVNDLDWLCAGKTILVNGRWLPPSQFHGNPETPHIGMSEGQIAYLVVDASDLRSCHFDNLTECLESWQLSLPKFPAGGQWIEYPWDLVELATSELVRDFTNYPLSLPDFQTTESLHIIGSRENLIIAASATVEPLVVFDTTNGPITVEENVHISAFSRIEGPCHIGPNTQIHGAKIRGGCYFGPQCRIGGEVEATIIHGYTNKYHEGFLGHGYLGEWINLGAGTHNSDLRNDYDEVSVIMQGVKIATGQKKVGCFIGDHTKTGLGTLRNTGTNIGPFCNVLPSAGFAPKYVPGFTTFWKGQLRETSPIPQLLKSAQKVMDRRGQVLTDVYRETYGKVYDETALVRLRALHREEKSRVMAKSA